MLDKSTRALINSARTLGGGALTLQLSDNELLRLCAVIAIDLGYDSLVGDIARSPELASGYYGISLEWFKGSVDAVDFDSRFAQLSTTIQDFTTYFKSLCEIHKRRLKYQAILSHQAIPHIETIVPRSLLEFGLHSAETLASWLVWKKWLYDIDNRSAQETGYLFEPILAAALGGVPYSAKTSPIKRTAQPTKGRQVDCIDGNTAYEFKMRVTIAASGQGRFKEELDFAEDCHNSGYVPVLLVLDPTPSARLDDLSAAYKEHAGQAFIGDEAWRHLKDKSGETMGRFIERYVRQPLREVDVSYTSLQPLQLTSTGDSIIIHIGSASSFTIARAETGLIEGSDEDSHADDK